MRLNIRKQRGLSLIIAIFLLVVIGGLLSFILTISGAQLGTSILNIKAARGLQAARTGIEIGAHLALNYGCSSFPSGSMTVETGSNMDFDVTISCSQTMHNESTSNINVYKLSSTATNGSWGSLDYTSRTIIASVSDI
ncbi:MAG: hypothetical protein ISR69_11535 [Gammaproteobacteria bacterium]|nr:hypothetical protein [Gammaproteobacteria bacterium]